VVRPKAAQAAVLGGVLQGNPAPGTAQGAPKEVTDSFASYPMAWLILGITEWPYAVPWDVCPEPVEGYLAGAGNM